MEQERDQHITTVINSFVALYPQQKQTTIRWEEPLVAFASVQDPLFSRLKSIVSPSHALPQDLLPDAQTVICYFLPFPMAVTQSNIQNRECSRLWAIAYLETNQLISELNTWIQTWLRQNGKDAALIPATHNFDAVKLISDWSHRHMAYIAGLGKFGLNNMLITDKGSGGRIGSLVTNAFFTPTPRDNQEHCLYKYNGSCQRCAKRCVNQALEQHSFDRQKCYQMCLANDRFHRDLDLTDVCGKCMVGVPCTHINPVKKVSKPKNGLNPA